MPSKTETKHERFLRLMQRRLERALEELRLVSKLSSDNYEYNAQEAEEVILHLDTSVRGIAQLFDVEYATRVGKASAKSTTRAASSTGLFTKKTVLDEVELMRTLELLRAGDIEQVDQILRSAVMGKAA